MKVTLPFIATAKESSQFQDILKAFFNAGTEIFCTEVGTGTSEYTDEPRLHAVFYDKPETAASLIIEWQDKFKNVSGSGSEKRDLFNSKFILEQAEILENKSKEILSRIGKLKSKSKAYADLAKKMRELAQILIEANRTT